MRRISFCKLFFLPLLACGAAAAADPKAEKEILDTTESFRQAYLKKDMAALEKLAHPDLIYVHSSGLRENKAEFLKALGRGAGFVRFDVTDPVVRVDGPLGLIQFKTDLRGTNAADRPNPLMLMLVWHKGPGGWRLIGRQAARMPDAAPAQKK